MSVISLELYKLTDKEGLQMPENVLCEVNNCTFWGEGNNCNAEEIYVVSYHGKKAEEQKETDCNTFQKK